MILTLAINYYNTPIAADRVNSPAEKMFEGCKHINKLNCIPPPYPKITAIFHIDSSVSTKILDIICILVNKFRYIVSFL